MTLEEYLKPFLAKLPVNEKGAEEYLLGLTREQKIEMSVGTGFVAPLDNNIAESRLTIVTNTVDKNIREFNEHIGDKLVYVLLNKSTPGQAMGFTIEKVWATDITEDTWEVAELRDDEHDSLPRLVRK